MGKLSSIWKPMGSSLSMKNKQTKQLGEGPASQPHLILLYNEIDQM